MNIYDMKLASAGKLELMRALVNKAEGENRDLNDDEKTNFETLKTEQASINARIEREETMQSEETNLSLVDGTPLRPGALVIDTDVDPINSPEYMQAFASACRARRNGVSDDARGALKIGTSDGDWAVPETYRKQMIAKLGNHNCLRLIANVITTTSTENIPVVNDNGTAGWVDELGEYPESDMKGARKVLGAHKLGRICKLSEEILQDQGVSLETTLSDAYAKSFGDAEETGMWIGDGQKKPNGIVNQVTREVVAALSTGIGYDDLVDLQHGVKRPYRQHAVYVMNDQTVKIVRKLKNDKGEPIWQDGMRAGEPDLLLGKPVHVSDAIDDVGAGKTSVFFGDFKQGVDIGDRGDVYMQRLEELYAKEGAIGFRMRARVDIVVKDPDAIAKFKHPAA